MADTAAATRTALSIIMPALQDGTFSTQTLVTLLANVDLGAETTLQIKYMMATMSNEEIAATFKSFITFDDTNVGTNMMRIIWILVGVSTLIMVARLFVKLRTVKRLYWDDVCMISGLVFAYLHAIFITKSYEHGLGRHLMYLNANDRSEAMHWAFMSIGWGFLSAMAGRLGICVFLMFVSGIDPKVKNWTLYAVMFLQVVVNLASVAIMYLQCGTHLYVTWGASALTESKRYCWDASVQSDYGYFAGSFNTVTDIFLTILPGLLILHTPIPRNQKIGLAFMLCLSVVAMAAAIVKTYEARTLSLITDYTHDLIPYIIWTSVETNIIIIVASIPFLRPLFQSVSNKFGKPTKKHGHVQDKFEGISLGSIVSSGKIRHMHSSSSSSCEHIAPQADPFAITQTREIKVTTTATDVTLVHAALVGLVQDDTAVIDIWH